MDILRSTLITLLLPAAMTAAATYTEAYYRSMDGKKKESLKQAAKECVSAHTRLDYYGLPEQWQYTDVYPDLYDGCKRWWEMYSNRVMLIRQGQSARQSFSSNGMNREHSIPKSWWKKSGDVEYTPAYTDLWNLYPSEAKANGAKLNYPFGPVAQATFDNGCVKVGTVKTGYGGGSGYVFEPADEYKGDFARSIFYMATVYDDLPWVYNWMFRTNSWPTLQPWAYDMLLQWSRQDPVSQKELDRNDAVQQAQGNRNPFIDFPELAEYIWGTRTTEVFRISEQGGQVTPPITGDPALTRPVNGETVYFGQCVPSDIIARPVEIRGANLTQPLTVRLAGADRSMFSVSVTSIPAVAINTGGTYLLQVEYHPTSLGEHEAVLSLYDGGLPLGHDVAVTLRGECVTEPKLTTLTALPPSDVTEVSYKANWQEASEVVDYYILTRVRYTADGPQASTHTTDGTSLLIEDRDPDVAESYSVQSARLGFTSEPSNTVMVGTGSAVDEIEEQQPLSLGITADGFILLIDGCRSNLRVFDITGRLVQHLPEVGPGQAVSLPQGIYIVTLEGDSHPRKIIIR